MKLDTVIHVYVAGDERDAWAKRIAEVFGYATLLEGTGVTKSWGTEPVTLVECWYDVEEREWSLYDDLFPALQKYGRATSQELVYVTIQSSGKIRGFLLDPWKGSDDEQYQELALFELTQPWK